jgi:hypothetical protein
VAPTRLTRTAAPHAAEARRAGRGRHLLCHRGPPGGRGLQRPHHRLLQRRAGPGLLRHRQEEQHLQLRRRVYAARAGCAGRAQDRHPGRHAGCPATAPPPRHPCLPRSLLRTRPPSSSHPPPATRHPPPATRHPPPATRHPPPASSQQRLPPPSPRPPPRTNPHRLQPRTSKRCWAARRRGDRRSRTGARGTSSTRCGPARSSSTAPSPSRASASSC